MAPKKKIVTEPDTAQKMHQVSKAFGEYASAYDVLLWLSGNGLLKGDHNLDDLAYSFAIRFAPDRVKEAYKSLNLSTKPNV